MACSNDLVTLKGGMVIPMVVIGRVIDLEFRGAHFSLEDGERFRVTPPAVLTADDVQFLRAHRTQVRDAIAYCDNEARRPL